MKIHTKTGCIAIAVLISSACGSNNEPSYDASGSFEADEIIISSEVSGVIQQLEIEEGQSLQSGEIVGYIDSTQLSLKKQQLESQLIAMLGKKPDIPVQLSALQAQLRTMEKEKVRLEHLIQGDAATPKQLDDLNAESAILRKKINAQKSSLSISSEGISKEARAVQVQIAQIEDQLRRCKITNPINGTVLAQYAEVNEMTTIGKPLYKIADLSVVFLRAYITGNQLPQVKLNQTVEVLTDDGKDGYKKTEGLIVWINDQAEFTPKTIQTKEERANKVYAIKVKIQNDGTYKIGMYGEIKLK